jgi:hypothetical protein
VRRSGEVEAQRRRWIFYEIIKVDLSKELDPSASGKRILIASIEGDWDRSGA